MERDAEDIAGVDGEVDLLAKDLVSWLWFSDKLLLSLSKAVFGDNVAEESVDVGLCKTVGCLDSMPRYPPVVFRTTCLYLAICALVACG